jgi:hypothetical protein
MCSHYLQVWQQQLAVWEYVLPCPGWQDALANLNVLQLAAGCQGCVGVCWGNSLLTAQAVREA